MSLSDLASIGSFVSGFAVLFSLIYLSLQVRQASKHQRALMLEERTSRVADFFLHVAEPSLATVWDKVWSVEGELSALEYQQLTALARSLFATAEVAYLQYREGLLSPRAFGTVKRSWSGLLGAPRCRIAWKQARASYDPQFVALMDQILNQTQIADVGASLAEFNRAVAAQLDA
jgi:hypothetical protein